MKDFENLSAQEVLKWGIEKFREKIAFLSSFSAEDIVIIDMIVGICKELKTEVNVFTIDTGRLPNETYDIIDKVRNKYGIKVKVYFPDYKEVESMVEMYGMNLFYESVEKRKLCCEVRKVKVLKRALEGLEAWITGLRRSQSITRVNVKKVEIDEVHGGIFKINPLADWNDEMVWNYIKENKLPYNNLYDKGYTSIGCAPCTRAVKKTEDPRAGRWWWESPEYKECGLHVKKI